MEVIEKDKELENEKLKEKSKKNKKTALIIIFIIIAVVLLEVFYVVGKNVSNLVENANKSKIELKQTETSKSNSNIDGIYITDVSEVVENVMPSIVAITSKTLVSSGMFGPSYFGQNSYSQGAGSGIIIGKTDEELLILTNNHVVEGANELSVKFIDDNSVDATIKGSTERKDIAVISVKVSSMKKETLEKIKEATIGDSSTLKVGNGVIAIGNALGYGQSVTTGVVSALNRSVTIDNYTNKMIQIDAAINGGNSGGALLNSSGEVVGINSAKYSSNSSSSASVEGMGFAIPITDVKDIINSLMNGKEINKGVTLGIQGYMTDEVTMINNMPSGFYVAEVTKDGFASKAGLEKGNIITKIDGEKIDSFDVLSNALYEKTSNDTAKLTVSYLDGNTYKEKTITVSFK